jgi:hypothetical protein
MGLFDKMFGTQSQVKETLSPAEAFAAITLAAVAWDGNLSEEESGYLSTKLSRMKLFRSYPKDVIGRMFDKLLGMLRREGFNSLFEVAKASLTEELREAAFATATDLILLDGIAAEEEQNFLNDLYQALGVPNQIATQILEVMLIKNRG